MLSTSSSLTLEAADKIADAVIDSVSKLAKPAPVTVSVLDSSGEIIVQKRMNGCPSGAYPKFSYAKARTCIHLTSSSRAFREKYTGSGEPPKFTQAASMVALMEGDLIPVAGGVLVRNSKDGSIVGAVGKLIEHTVHGDLVSHLTTHFRCQWCGRRRGRIPCDSRCKARLWRGL
jgi:uncharacterized protein GlcG (DUF336 family)